MTTYKLSIILFVLILLALNVGHAAALPIVDPVHPHCPTVSPDCIYFVGSYTVTSQHTNGPWQYVVPFCDILPPGPVVWA